MMVTAPLDMGFISRADVADFLVKQIDDEAFLHKTPVLTSSSRSRAASSRELAGGAIAVP
jgi:hypothetical protein